MNNLAGKSNERFALDDEKRKKSQNNSHSPADICSLNCTANNPFVSAGNEVTVMPHLNSLETLHTDI